MDFNLREEHKMLKDLVGRFVRDELWPLEAAVLAREAEGQPRALTPEERAPLDARSRELGLWGLDAPEQCGGTDLPLEAMIGVNEEMGRTITPYTLPPDSPNLKMLAATVNDQQREKYLLPYVQGKTISAIAISEPGAGADPAMMKTNAIKTNEGWVINGRKIWISRAAQADFTILMAVTDKQKNRGISAFLVDKDTKGFHIKRPIAMIGGNTTYEIEIDDCHIPDENLLGEEGQGFAPMQLRLATRRLQMASWCIGMASRALEMICDYAPQRQTFGAPLAERQTIQWWVADAATQIHAARLMAYHAACKADQGGDVRVDISMVKAFATEMAAQVVDHAMQVFGAMGMTRELPLHMMASEIRLMRIYDGPTEVHRWVIARDLLKLKRGKSS